MNMKSNKIKYFIFLGIFLFSISYFNFASADPEINNYEDTNYLNYNPYYQVDGVSNKKIEKVVNTNKIATEKINSDEGSNGTNNELTALSFRGSGGFMPSSIWQWMIVIALILVIIVLARMIGKKDHNPHGAH